MGSVMNFDKILQKPFLISVFVFNIILFGVIVFLLGYVQNLLDSDSRNNLEEIVSQNKNVITSKLLLDLNRLDIISNKISDGLKNKNITKEAELNKFLEDYYQLNDYNKKVLSRLANDLVKLQLEDSFKKRNIK